MREHRVLVFLDDFNDPETWGVWCADCPLSHFGSPTDIYPKRLAKKHAKATKPILQEAS